MKRSWIPLIVVFACLTAFIFIVRDKSNDLERVSESNPAKLSGKPARIVSLAPNLTEILFALGLGEKIIAVSNNSNYPAATANKKKVGSFWQPNTEAIIACKPDLVVTLQTRTEQQKAAADSLERLGFKVLSLKIEKIGELFTAIEEIGRATGCEERSDELLKSISNQLNVLQSKVGSVNKVRVLWAVQTEPLRVAGRNTFINELIELGGGENAIGPTISQYPQIGSEQLLGCGAERIIQSAMGGSNIAEEQKAAENFWGRWSNLPAVKNNRIYVIESDTTLRLGPRLPQGAEAIARFLHPDSFKQRVIPHSRTGKLQ
ncbi:MAG: ABC transporter substrate-binding protein [Planctomycetota bacterium]|nr:MAG: ABC transporter substrate-binding protein [Planctomycetota bacterium]